MSADTEARQLKARAASGDYFAGRSDALTRVSLFEHLVVDHAVRVDRKRYLPSLEAMARTHAQIHEPTGSLRHATD